jgi:hypothetical protein
MLTLYFAPGSSSMVVHIALHEIGAPFKAMPMSFKQNDMRKAEGRIRQPRCALRADDGADGGAKDHRDRDGDRLRTAGVTPFQTPAQRPFKTL